MSCKPGCKESDCNGNCKIDRPGTRRRVQDLDDCDAWRCGCGASVMNSNVCGSCRTTKVAGDCAMFGVNFNAERKASDFSPADVKAIIARYSDEPITLTGVIWNPVLDALGVVVPGWYTVTLGGLAVSHQFCLNGTITGIVETGGGGVTVTPARWGVAGEEVACREGAWWRVVNRLVQNTTVIADPRTGVSCAPCPPAPCDFSPARGAEHFYIYAPSLTPLALPVGGVFSVTRCDWLDVRNQGIDGVNGRLPAGNIGLRVTAGEIPVF